MTELRRQVSASSARYFRGTMKRAAMALWSAPKLHGLTRETIPMAGLTVPHFHNTPGVETIHIGAKEFQCIGAKPPFDHPHVYLDMGDEDEIICPYCSTHFRYDPSLGPSQAMPGECTWHSEEVA